MSHKSLKDQAIATLKRVGCMEIARRCNKVASNYYRYKAGSLPLSAYKAREIIAAGQEPIKRSAPEAAPPEGSVVSNPDEQHRAALASAYFPLMSDEQRRDAIAKALSNGGDVRGPILAMLRADLGS